MPQTEVERRAESGKSIGASLCTTADASHASPQLVSHSLYVVMLVQYVERVRGTQAQVTAVYYNRGHANSMGRQ